MGYIPDNELQGDREDVRIAVGSLKFRSVRLRPCLTNGTISEKGFVQPPTRIFSANHNTAPKWGKQIGTEVLSEASPLRIL